MKKQHILTLTLAALVLLPVLAGCSIKEDRSDAPVWMRLDRSNITGDYSGPFIFSEFWGDVLFFRDSYNSVSSFLSQGYIPLPQGKVTISGIGGVDGMYFDRDSLLLIPEGKDADAIYAFVTDIQAEGDLCNMDAQWHKEHCRVTLDMMIEPGGDCLYDLRLRSNVVGLNVRTLEPIRGDWRFKPVIDPVDAKYRFNLLRQFPADKTVSPTRSDLLIELWGDEGLLFAEPGTVPVSTGVELLDTIDLGAIIADHDLVDWTAPDLPDIEIRIDYARMKLYIRVADWVMVDLGEIVI